MRSRARHRGQGMRPWAPGDTGTSTDDTFPMSATNWQSTYSPPVLRSLAELIWSPKAEGAHGRGTSTNNGLSGKSREHLRNQAVGRRWRIRQRRWDNPWGTAQVVVVARQDLGHGQGQVGSRRGRCHGMPNDLRLRLRRGGRVSRGL